MAIQFPGRDNPSLHPIGGGDADGPVAKLDAARERLAKVSGQTPEVTLCYEAGYDGFWLARFLGHRGIDCLVMDPASLQVTRQRPQLVLRERPALPGRPRLRPLTRRPSKGLPASPCSRTAWRKSAMEQPR